MPKRIIKGDFEYIKKKRIRVILMTILFFAISIAVFLVGYITTGSKKNLLTVVAILGCLPACKSAVNMIMFIKAKGCSDEANQKILPHIGRLIPMYDMYFTSYKKNFAISNMVVDNKVIIGFSEDPKIDIQEGIQHLNTMMKNAGHTGCTITLCDSIDKYIEMLDNLNVSSKEAASSEDTSNNKDDEIRISLYEITL